MKRGPAADGTKLLRPGARLLWDPPPSTAVSWSPPVALERSRKCRPHPRKAPQRADATPERHWDS